MGYNILNGGRENPVYTKEVVDKLKETHQKKYTNILKYSFDGKKFHFIESYNGLRDAARENDADFRAI